MRMWRSLGFYSFQGICGGSQSINSSLCQKDNLPRKIYHLEKGSEICGCV